LTKTVLIPGSGILCASARVSSCPFDDCQTLFSRRDAETQKETKPQNRHSDWDHLLLGPRFKPTSVEVWSCRSLRLCISARVSSCPFDDCQTLFSRRDAETQRETKHQTRHSDWDHLLLGPRLKSMSIAAWSCPSQRLRVSAREFSCPFDDCQTLSPAETLSRRGKRKLEPAIQIAIICCWVQGPIQCQSPLGLSSSLRLRASQLLSFRQLPDPLSRRGAESQREAKPQT